MNAGPSQPVGLYNTIGSRSKSFRSNLSQGQTIGKKEMVAMAKLLILVGCCFTCCHSKLVINTVDSSREFENEVILSDGMLSSQPDRPKSSLYPYEIERFNIIYRKYQYANSQWLRFEEVNRKFTLLTLFYHYEIIMNFSCFAQFSPISEMIVQELH